MNAVNIDEDFSVDEELDDLVSAEDFLEYFELDYDETVVKVNRLHILARYHEYISKTELPEEEALRREKYKEMLEKAYHDFVVSDPKTEKALKIYKNIGPQATFVSLDKVFK